MQSMRNSSRCELRATATQEGAHLVARRDRGVGVGHGAQRRCVAQRCAPHSAAQRCAGRRPDESCLVHTRARFI
eukprot:2083724-Pleurochrysis_carterae.AAC.4